jgi:hypothetical protein
MALFDNLLEGGAARGLAIGIGAAVLVPIALPVLATVGKPVARAAIKTGILMYEKGRETVAEFTEVMEDLVAEAKADLEQSHATEAQIQQTMEEAEQKVDKE